MIKKVLFLYKTPRKHVYRDWRSGKGPDTILYGANNLETLGYNVDIFDISFSKLNPLRWLFYPLQFIAAKRTGLGFNLGQAVTLLPLLNRYDVIFSTIDSAGLPLLLLKKIGLVKKPIIYMSIDFAFRLEDNNKWPFIWYKNLLTYADAIICNYVEEKKILDKYNKKVYFIKVGVDKHYYNNDKKNNTVKRNIKLLAFGRDRDRDYLSFVSAVKNLNVLSQIVCSPSNMINIKLADNIKVFYDLSPQELRKKIFEASIIVIPINNVKRSGGHLSLLDSLMGGKPVVVASNNGITKTYNFKNGQDCLFYQPGNIMDLKSKIKLLIKDTKLASNLALNGRKKAEKYSTVMYAKEIDKIIRKITEKTI